MTQFLPQRAVTRAMLIFTAVLGALLIITAVQATTLGPIALWLVGLFVTVLLWLASRRR
jgi:hypothetical protein